MSVLRMRDAGRSWSEISAATGLSVAAAREAVSGAKRQRRADLARTPRNERARGLLDECQSGFLAHTCRHPRKEHDADGFCLTCAHDLERPRGCEGFARESHLFALVRPRENVAQHCWQVLVKSYYGDINAAWRTYAKSDAAERRRMIRSFSR